MSFAWSRMLCQNNEHTLNLFSTLWMLVMLVFIRHCLPTFGIPLSWSLSTRHWFFYRPEHRIEPENLALDTCIIIINGFLRLFAQILWNLLIMFQLLCIDVFERNSKSLFLSYVKGKCFLLKIENTFNVTQCITTWVLCLITSAFNRFLIRWRK